MKAPTNEDIDSYFAKVLNHNNQSSKELISLKVIFSKWFAINDNLMQS
jgi:hypothetical protein